MPTTAPEASQWTSTRLLSDPTRKIKVIVEVPLRSDPIKYEFDKAAGAIVVDRFLYTTMFYPCNYGSIVLPL
jgi:inorganic pyrophosphatase